MPYSFLRMFLVSVITTSAVTMSFMAIANDPRYLTCIIKSMEYDNDVVKVTLTIKNTGSDDVNVKHSHLINIVRKTNFYDDSNKYTIRVIDENKYQYTSSSELHIPSSQIASINLTVECKGGPKYIDNGIITDVLRQTLKLNYKIDTLCMIRKKNDTIQSLMNVRGAGVVSIIINKK